MRRRYYSVVLKLLLLCLSVYFNITDVNTEWRWCSSSLFLIRDSFCIRCL
jgi:hypothetical protein